MGSGRKFFAYGVLGIAALVACGGEHGDESATTGARVVGSCTQARGGGGWTSSSFAPQSSRFVVELDATPSDYGTDAVVGLSSGPATSFSKLAAIVRFNTNGTIDVRNGSTYAADASVQYAAGAPHHFRILVDVPSHTYSVWVTTPYRQETFLASNYAFRTEQAGVTSLDSVSAFVDMPSGTVSACNVTLDDLSSCTRANAGGGWTNAGFAPQSAVFTASWDARPSVDGIDAVVGFAGAPASAFSSLASIVRFAPGGTIDVRNGSSYTATTSIPYRGGITYRFTANVNVVAHTYSVWVTPPGSSAVQIANDFAFRTEQSGATSLSDAALEVDSATGFVEACDLTTKATPGGQLWSRPIGGAIAPTADGGALAAGSTTTSVVDRSGNVVRTLPFGGGAIGVDGAGNVYTATGGADITVAKYDAQYAPVWTTTVGGTADDAVRAFGVARSGDLAVFSSSHAIYALDTDGHTRFTREGESIIEGVVQMAVDGSGNTILLGDTGGKTFVEKRDRAGEFVFRRLSSGGAGTTDYEDPIAIAASAYGDIAFVGKFHGTINFGGSDLWWNYPATSEAPYTTAYIVKLDAAGNHVFSRTEQSSSVGHIGGVAIDPLGRVTWTFNGYNAPSVGYVEAYDQVGATLWGNEAYPRYTDGVRMNDAGETFLLAHDMSGAPVLTKYSP